MNYKETAVLYLVCVLTFILSGFLLFSKNISRRLYLLTIIAILCIEGAYIGIRWFDTGHPPIFGTFEATLCASWMLILFSGLILIKQANLWLYLSRAIGYISMRYLHG